MRMRGTLGILVLFASMLIPASIPAEADPTGSPGGGDEGLGREWRLFAGDEFNGGAVDGRMWDTSILLSGLRTFPAGPNQSEAQWGDPVSLQPPPYGRFELKGGAASFSAGVSRAFPFLFAGPPLRTSPFPAQGDFLLELRMRWDRSGRQGPWILCTVLDSFAPGEAIPGVMEGQAVFGLMSCNNRGTRAYGPGFPLGDQHGERGVDLRALCDVRQFNDFRLVCANGWYTLTVNGKVAFGPIWSPLRPRNILIGSYAVTTWESADWSCFTIDHIRVLVPPLGDGLPGGSILAQG